MTTSVLNPRESGKLVAKLAKDVTLNPEKIKSLAKMITSEFANKAYRLENWKEHELHPKGMNTNAVHWILAVDALNYCFWPSPGKSSYGVKYNGKLYTGYWSLHACIRRALEEGIPITEVKYFANVTEDELKHILRSNTDEEIPLFEERYASLTEAGQVVMEKFDGSFVNCIEQCGNSAEKLVKLIVDNFSSFRDEAELDGHKISFHKRAQILVGDIWSCFQAQGLGAFDDIEYLTMFADYRVPQVLVFFEAMTYSPELLEKLKKNEELENGKRLEVEIRGCSIAAVELIKEEVTKLASNDTTLEKLCNSCILDYYLWDYRRSHAEKIEERVPYHKVRCIYY